MWERRSHAFPPHYTTAYRLLICKLRAYGLSVNACDPLKIYFCERKQRVKLGDKYSEWLGLSKGVQQGSLMQW